jgi:hypothetical protein
LPPLRLPPEDPDAAGRDLDVDELRGVGVFSVSSVVFVAPFLKSVPLEPPRSPCRLGSAR